MLPWAEMLRAGLQLGLTPASFWACSLKEWRVLTRAPVTVMGRQGFERLAAKYPDRKERFDGRS
ncbi:phage tail assembly chaperone [Henriciella sp.]|uniref:phage tail assembly chaperone n=1 Tax=Henriciella sp. TaxID=1968823 RepID=UPI002613EE44|nr:phage tail assembly chaperone [Henriciella sp.]